MQIGNVTKRDESLEIERNQLPTKSRRQGSTNNLFGDGDERLLEIQRIPIDRRQDLFGRRERTLRLRHDLNMAAETNVGAQLQPLQQPFTAVASHRTKKLRVIALETLAEVYSERHIEWLRRRLDHVLC